MSGQTSQIRTRTPSKATRIIANPQAIMRGAIGLSFALVAGFAIAAPLTPGASVTEHFGNIQYREPAGGGVTIRQLTTGGNYGEPTLSPDGRTVAFVHIDAPTSGESDASATSLWIADGPTGKAWRLLSSEETDDKRDHLPSFDRPIFSLDGHFIYITAELAAVTTGVHQINATTGQQRFVIEGGLRSLIRTGPYRGYLIVGRHMYYAAPRVGSYDAAYVVRPDGKIMFMIPASDDDQHDHVASWLQANDWEAW